MRQIAWRRRVSSSDQRHHQEAGKDEQADRAQQQDRGQYREAGGDPTIAHEAGDDDELDEKCDAPCPPVEGTKEADELLAGRELGLGPVLELEVEQRCRNVGRCDDQSDGAQVRRAPGEREALG